MENEKKEIIEQELERTKHILAELQEIIESSFDGILVTDGEGNVLLVNQSYVRNTNIQKEQLLGRNIRELINPVWMKNSVALLAIEQRRPVSLQHTTMHGKNIIVTGTPIFDENKNIKKVVVNTRDISEIYELREELIKAREMEKIYFEQLNSQTIPGDKDKEGIVIANNKMRNIYSLAKKISNFNTTVMILGESGVGKEHLAKFLHNVSIRQDKPFIAINCGAIPENLLESELFGYTEGAFTGASKGGKHGLIKAADGGTLFLDEIGEMSLNLQVKLLRVLETRTISRIGSSEEEPVDVRVIVATNRNLKEMVAKGEFREDLYYRLNVVTVEIPPLRERRDEIIPLALRFLNQFNKQYGQNKKLTYDVLKELMEQDWPGNIRQLRNVIENMVVISNNEYLQLNDLPWKQDLADHEVDEDKNPSLKELLEDYERTILIKAKEQHGSSRKIAKALKVDQSTIVRKLKKYKIACE